MQILKGNLNHLNLSSWPKQVLASWLGGGKLDSTSRGQELQSPMAKQEMELEKGREGGSFLPPALQSGMGIGRSSLRGEVMEREEELKEEVTGRDGGCTHTAL